MPHVTFIHGIANKPPKKTLLSNWKDALEAGGLNLATKGVSTSMVYWADVLYAAPLEEGADFESVDSGLGTGADDEDLAWIEALPDDERRMVTAMRQRLGFDAESPEGDQFETAIALDEEAAPTFEAIPLPWFIKRRVMKALLKDAHHYLFNASFSPREGETYQVQDHIRGLFVQQLKDDRAGNSGGPHIVVSHSMGTVISYDCLKNVPDCPPIDGYMTVGSPLGISEVHDNFKPKYEKKNAFPDKVNGRWINVYDRLDPVALDAQLANDYQKGGDHVILDQRVRNRGKWRHSSHKYYEQEKLCDHLKDLLGL